MFGVPGIMKSGALMAWAASCQLRAFKCGPILSSALTGTITVGHKIVYENVPTDWLEVNNYYLFYIMYSLSKGNGNAKQD